ncbi:ISL3 family transposase [Enterococcus sp. DIV0187]|uniref:ISL3 family transposase n=1 Tax=Enterococcus sp. DIV0187 TaxID=2774644 RepID=UPI003F258993
MIVCLDDFALRKRHSYGSILVDFQTKKVIDLFPSRSQESVTQWLSSVFQDISFVIRDGAIAFRNAISQAFPEAIQIADRFHVLKSLTDHALQAIRPLIPSQIQIKYEKISSMERTAPTISQQVKQNLVEQVRQKRQLGWSFAKIGRYFSLDPRTVKRYCDRSINTLDDHQRKERLTRLDQYKELLVEAMTVCSTLKQVYEILVESGYDRTFETFQRSYKQVLAKTDTDVSRTKVHKRPINRLIFEHSLNWSQLDNVSKTVLENTPLLVTIIQFVQKFRKILSDCSFEQLDQWIQQVRELRNSELNKFVNGLERDKDAIENALIYPELSNGLAEGKVNKLKKIKRIMFGRCSFETLRTKMILSEL